MTRVLLAFLFGFFPFINSYGESLHSQCPVSENLTGIWKIKDIPMRAVFKGKADSWTCESFDIEIESAKEGFIIRNCTAHCGSYWGSYNCLTTVIHIEQNQLSYYLKDGRNKTIGICDQNGVTFKNERSIDRYESWPLVGNGKWTLGVNEQELIFHFRLFTTKDENDFWEISPLVLPLPSR